MAHALPVHRSAAPSGLQNVTVDGTFEGYASLFHHEDLGRDIVMPGAFRETLSRRGAAGVKLLYQHDACEPLGVWEMIREDARGLYVRGRLLPGVARARDVLALIRAGALDGLSIGFRAVKAQRAARAGVRRLERVDLLEISIVTFPMQTGARILAVDTDGSSVAETRSARRSLQLVSSRQAQTELVREGKLGRDPVLAANARAARAAGTRVLAALSRLVAKETENATALSKMVGAASHTYKYRPDQPRAPAGGPDGGQWVAEGGGGWSSGRIISDAMPDENWKPGAQYAQNQFDPSRRGWHDYTVGPNLVCPADLRCTREEIADYMARHAVPGQSAVRPVVDGQRSTVYYPGTRVPGGIVETTIGDDGLTIVNRTLPLHVFYDGYIVRRAEQSADGSWHVSTRGVGNNIVPGANRINQWQGPRIFDAVDAAMRKNIERHHGKSIKNMAAGSGSWARAPLGGLGGINCSRGTNCD